MPWTLLRSLTKDIFAMLVLALAGLTALFTVILLMQVIQKVEGIGAGSVIGFIPTLAMGYQGYLIPIACLTATAVAYGRLSCDGEARALYAAGVKPGKLLLPAAAIGLVMCIPASLAVFYAGPKAYARNDGMKREAIADVIASPPPGQRNLNFPGLSLSYRNVNGSSFEGLVVVQSEENRVLNVLTAERAQLRYDRITQTLSLTEAPGAMLLSYDENGALTGQPSRLDVRLLERGLDVGRQGKRVSFKADTPRELVLYVGEELKGELAGAKPGKRFTWGEAVKRLMFACAPMLFAVFGAFVGLLIPARNRIVPLGIAMAGTCAVFFSLSAFANRMAVDGSFSPLGSLWPGGWVIAAVVSVPLLAIVIALWWRLHRA